MISIEYKGSSIPAKSKIYSLVFEMNMSEYNGTSSPLSSLDFIYLFSHGETGILAMLGDVNDDGKITTEDAQLISQFMAGTLKPTDRQKLAMDVNMDGVINLLDVTAVQRM